MTECQWEEEECNMLAHGGEFYCLTHLVESKVLVRKSLEEEQEKGDQE